MDAASGALDAPEAELALLPAKLAQPRVPSTFIPRPAVQHLLDDGTRGPLTVVSAGPGWGKTLAAAYWAAHGPRVGHVAWLSLDEADNEPRMFWSYFVAALRSAGGVPADNPLATLVPGLGRDDEYSKRVAAGLGRLPASVAVVLDDVHLIREPAVLEGVSELLRHRHEMLRLVLLTRGEPRVPVHRLRTAGDLVEIRARDLALTPSQASSLLAAHGVSVTPDEAELLVRRTEGWPAGLRLAALYLTQHEPRRRVADFAGDEQTVSSYLAEEVLASQPHELRDFLLRTSIVDRISSGLAEVLTGRPHCQRHLEDLESSNAFVVGLGPGREWFRYHALLREMLIHRLLLDEPELLPELHRRAAQWFADRGDPIEALNHAADAEDWPLVGRFFVTQASPLLVSADRTTLDHVLGRIPPAHLSDGPEMALCAAARLFHAGLYEEMQPHLEVAAAEVERSDLGSRVGTVATQLLLSMALARTRGDVSTVISTAAQALDVVSGEDSTLPAGAAWRAIALGNLGTGLLWDGQISAAHDCLRQGLAATEQLRIGVAQVNVLSHLGVIAAAWGELSIAADHASRAVELAESRGWESLPQAATAYLTLSTTSLLRNDAARAQALLTQGHAASVPDPAPRLALSLAQVRLDASLGRVEAARERLLELQVELTNSKPPTFLARWLAITEAEVELAEGAAHAAAARFGSPSSHEPPYAREQATLARALLESGDAERAERTLAPLRSGDGQDVEVEAWLLTALAADSLREDNRATEAMARAVRASRSEQVRRPFVVLDDVRVPRLLTRVKEVDPRLTDVVDDLLLHVVRESPPRLPPEGPTEPLTDRELMVVKFLPTMMTNSEIAAELYVSVNTVKAHLKRIYRKLDVDSRRQAVHRARALSLLLDPDDPPPFDAAITE